MSFVSKLIFLVRWISPAAEHSNRLRVSWDVVTVCKNELAYCLGVGDALYQRLRVRS
jgi:hypothetical protein